jgi:CheY-like chemotaxis protein
MARILVVEDDFGQLEVRRLILEQSGHEVVTAQTAAEALDRLPGCQIVLMDLQLPTREDGRRLILATSGAARIVVLSGAEPEEMPPVDAFLNKPCSSRKLLETIARFCLLLVCLSVLRGATVNVSRAQSRGTSTRALMARWGRTTDVEYVYRAFSERATIQAKGHKEVEFGGRREGTHPLLMPITDNNMIGEVHEPTPIRYQIAPVLVDLSGHSREEVMDQHPIAFEVMAQGLRHEDKLRPFGEVSGETVSDPVNYMYFEMKLACRESLVATFVHLKGDPRWYSSHLGHADFAVRTWTRGSAESASGFVRTTVELPPGTRPDQIAEIGFECIVPEKAGSDSASRVEVVTKCFFLDHD